MSSGSIQYMSYIFEQDIQNVRALMDKEVLYYYPSGMGTAATLLPLAQLV